MNDKQKSDFEFFRTLVKNGEPTTFAFSKGDDTYYRNLIEQEKAAHTPTIREKAVAWCQSLARSIPVGKSIPMTLHLRDPEPQTYTDEQTAEHKRAAMNWLGRKQ